MKKNDRSPSIVALIPARSGSKRVPNKNIRALSEHPLLAYTITAAIESKVFSAVVVSTDSTIYADIARYYDAEVPFFRPSELSGDLSPDIEWVEHALKTLAEKGRTYDCFSILRPTNPFRQIETIQRSWKTFINEKGIDSLRAVEKCKQHPGKMWVIDGKRMVPLLPLGRSNQPWHSSQYQSLPEVYVQNASLEIAWSRVVYEDQTIAGRMIMPFFTQGYEGLDINESRDWWYAEFLIDCGKATLPKISRKPFLIPGLTQLDDRNG